MAVQSYTVGTLVEQVAYFLTNNSTAPTALANRIKDALGWVLGYMVDASRDAAFIKAGTFNTEDGTSTYPLDDSVSELIYPSVRFTASPFTVIPYLPQQYHDQSGLASYFATEGRPMFYNIAGRDGSTGAIQMKMFPTPDAIYAVGYQYHSLPTPITNATSDGTSLDVRFPRIRVQALVAGACLFFPHYLAESQRVMLEQTSGMTLAMMQQRANVSGVSQRQQLSYHDVMREGGRNNAWPTTIYTGSPVR